MATGRWHSREVAEVAATVGDAVCGELFRDARRLGESGEALSADMLQAIYAHACEVSLERVRPLVDDCAWADYRNDERSRARIKRQRRNGRVPRSMRSDTAFMFLSMLQWIALGLICGRSPRGVQVFDAPDTDDLLRIGDYDPDGTVLAEVAAAFEEWLGPDSWAKFQDAVQRLVPAVAS